MDATVIDGANHRLFITAQPILKTTGRDILLFLRHLLDGYGFRKISGLVHVAASQQGDVI